MGDVPDFLYGIWFVAYLNWFVLYRTKLGSYLFWFVAYLFSFRAYLIELGSYLFPSDAYLFALGSYLFSSDKEQTKLGKHRKGIGKVVIGGKAPSLTLPRKREREPLPVSRGRNVITLLPIGPVPSPACGGGLGRGLFKVLHVAEGSG